jgi:hypothetical protein
MVRLSRWSAAQGNLSRVLSPNTSTLATAATPSLSGGVVLGRLCERSSPTVTVPENVDLPPTRIPHRRGRDAVPAVSAPADRRHALPHIDAVH